MKILEVETFGRGGLAHYAYNLSQALSERGHSVTLATTPTFELDALTQDRPGVEVLRPIGRAAGRLSTGLPGLLRRGVVRAEALSDAVTIGLLARRIAPDLVHLHCTNPVAAAYLSVLRLLRQPTVYTAHVVTPHEPIPFDHTIYRQIHRLSELIVVHSSFDRDRLRDEFPVDPARIVVIPHGEYGFFERNLDAPDRDTARRALGLDPDDEVALFFGYVRRYKGLDLLLDSWPAVKAARPQARLVVAGDPINLSADARSRLVEHARQVGAQLHLEYVPVSEVAGYFRAADALVMPYRRMSQSGVLFLGLSLGVPVVATRVGPLPEMLTDGESALLVAPDSPPALADAVIRVLGDARLRQTLAAGGRRVAAQHSWPSIAAQTEQAFVRVVERYRESS